MINQTGALFMIFLIFSGFSYLIISMLVSTIKRTKALEQSLKKH
jgi:hypothetical protein